MDSGLWSRMLGLDTQTKVCSFTDNHRPCTDEGDAQPMAARRHTPQASVFSHEGNGKALRSLTDREGKFYDLSRFMVMPSNFQPTYRLASQLNLRPGQIIHIIDGAEDGSNDETRIHKRVMLVLIARCSATMTCLTFCRHARPADAEDHWRVCEAGSPEQHDPNSHITPLQVTLHPAWPATTTPQSGITINIRDFWNVETEVRAAVLGAVETASMRALAERVQDLFCQLMNEAVPPIARFDVEPTLVNEEPAEIRVHETARKKPGRGVYVRYKKKDKR